jgi:hypothetical protein
MVLAGRVLGVTRIRLGIMIRIISRFYKKLRGPF